MTKCLKDGIKSICTDHMKCFSCQLIACEILKNISKLFAEIADYIVEIIKSKLMGIDGMKFCSPISFPPTLVAIC